ncbi:Delta and Notch-like epidermal growth factor-related receptor [Aix galericulata]|nr:Delta and Notch-like epidermal growth factor-related receptor [Aix galericulata]
MKNPRYRARKSPSSSSVSSDEEKQFVSDPCASNPCHHGNCSTSGDGYLCICSEGYEGTNCEHSFRSLPASEPMEPLPPSQSRPVPSTLEPDIVLPHSRATVTLPTWQPKAGQKVVDLKWDEIEATFFCDCEDEYQGSQCEEFDACQSQPCQNNATCTDLAQKHDGNNFTCSCLAGFLGTSCEDKIDPCASSPCQNNGTCYADRLVFSCSCSPGFTGPMCAQLIDFCALNPCAHGICRSVGTSYKCLCIPGYHGLYCEEEYNECLSAPCQNGATCRDLVNSYECACLAEYEGEECEIDINDCDSNPCHHAGTCIDQPSGYTCHCPHGWVGANCEIHLQWKSGHMAESLTNMPRHSLYIIIGALCVAFVLMLIILIVGICRISRIEYQGSSRPAYEEFYNCRSIDSEFSNAIASIRHARFGKKSRPAMYDATPIAYEDYSPDDKPLVMRSQPLG